MRNSKSAYLFTYYNIWKLVSISIINAVLFPITIIQSGQTNIQTHKNRVSKTPHRRDGSALLLVGTGRTKFLVPPNLQ